MFMIKIIDHVNYALIVREIGNKLAGNQELMNIVMSLKLNGLEARSGANLIYRLEGNVGQVTPLYTHVYCVRLFLYKYCNRKIFN